MEDKNYRTEFLKAIVERLLPEISRSDLFHFDKVSWVYGVMCSQETTSNISESILEHSLLGANSPVRLTVFCEELGKIKKGDQYVSNILVAKISYELEVENIYSRVGERSTAFNNPFIDFKLMEKGPGRDELTNHDFEMFFDIVKCSPELQGIIRMLYSSNCDQVVWEKMCV